MARNRNYRLYATTKSKLLPPVKQILSPTLLTVLFCIIIQISTSLDCRAEEGDYYSVLGVSKKSSLEEIRHNYRKLARKYHPDLNPNEVTAEQFRKIQEAYDVLGDSQKRRAYDRGPSRGALALSKDFIFLFTDLETANDYNEFLRREFNQLFDKDFDFGNSGQFDQIREQISLNKLEAYQAMLYSPPLPPKEVAAARSDFFDSMIAQLKAIETKRGASSNTLVSPNDLKADNYLAAVAVSDWSEMASPSRAFEILVCLEKPNREQIAAEYMDVIAKMPDSDHTGLAKDAITGFKFALHNPPSFEWATSKILKGFRQKNISDAGLFALARIIIYGPEEVLKRYKSELLNVAKTISAPDAKKELWAHFLNKSKAGAEQRAIMEAILLDGNTGLGEEIIVLGLVAKYPDSEIGMKYLKLNFDRLPEGWPHKITIATQILRFDPHNDQVFRYILSQPHSTYSFATITALLGRDPEMELAIQKLKDYIYKETFIPDEAEGAVLNFYEKKIALILKSLAGVVVTKEVMDILKNSVEKLKELGQTEYYGENIEHLNKIEKHSQVYQTERTVTCEGLLK